MNDVTIIVTTYDRPGYLPQCLASLPDVRVLVVDDSIGGYARRIAAGAEYMRTSGQVGTSRARLLGLAQVDTPYFAFFDDDDVMLPNWLPLHLAKMAEGFDVVGSWHWETDAALNHVELKELAAPTLAGLLAVQVTVSDNALIRRSALDGCSWYPERKHVMMFTMWLALMAKGRKFAMIEEPTWLYRQHGANQSPSTRDPADAEWRRIAVAEHGS